MATTPVRTATPTLPPHLTCRQSFTIDPDIAMELDDRARVSGLRWAQWLEKFVNESMRANLFG